MINQANDVICMARPASGGRPASSRK
jgi:hypothetical protein